MSIDFQAPFLNDFPRVNYLKSTWGAAPACSTPDSSKTTVIIRYPPPMMMVPPWGPSCSTRGGFGPIWVYHCYIFLRHLCLNSEIVMFIFRLTFSERFIELISKVSGTFYRANGRLILDLVISSVQSLSRVRLFSTPWIAAHQAFLSIINSWSLLKPMSIKSIMPPSHLILCYPLLLLPPIPPSIRVFPNESALRIRWPKYWRFSFRISPSNEHPGLISFRMDWLDLLAVQGLLKSLLQHHSSKASIFWHSAFFTVQLSHPYMTTGKTMALTQWTFVGNVSAF